MCVSTEHRDAIVAALSGAAPCPSDALAQRPTQMRLRRRQSEDTGDTVTAADENLSLSKLWDFFTRFEMTPDVSRFGMCLAYY